MRVEPNTSRTRRFQEQIIPDYLNTDLDFYYKADFLSTSEDFEFGLKSADGQKRSKFNFRSGLVYDYSGRLISTYRGETSLEYGLQKIVGNYLAYEKINSRPISLGDEFSDYENRPFDRFYVENSGTSPVEFNLDLRGFSPPTIYSPLTLIGGTTYSGNLTQSGWAENLSQGVKYGMFGLSVPAANGSVSSFDSSGSGILHYFISGNNLADGSSFPIEFDTFFGKVQRNVTVVGAGGDSQGSETGISLSLYGQSNLLAASQSLDFSVSYFSNSPNDIVVELSSSGSFSSPILSGFSRGFLDYSGEIIKSGLLYSSPFVTGIADLLAAENLSYNTQYTVYDQFINTRLRVAARTTGSFYTGVNTFSYTGIPMFGVYNGPYPQFIGLYFSGLGDISINYDFQESDEGVHVFAESYVGFLNSGYSSQFALASSEARLSTDPIFYDNSKTIFPTGEAYGYIGKTVTGQGSVVKSVEFLSFFGEGTGRVLDGRISVNGSGTGNITYSGNAYKWRNYSPEETIFPPVMNGAYCLMDAFEGDGVLSNGISSFKGTGLPSPLVQTWGYPTGPSKIIIQPQLLEIYQDINIPFVSGYMIGSGSLGIVPTGAPFSGRSVGYVSYNGGIFEGPVFPSPEDTGLYPYLGDNGGLRVVGDAFYGRGMIVSSGSVDDGSTQYGIFIRQEDSAPAYFDLSSGNFRAVYETGVNEFAVPTEFIFPARYAGVTEGDDFLVYDKVSLEFKNPDFEKVETGIISGRGFVPVSNLNLRYDLFYSENPDSFPSQSYKDNGWFTPTSFIRPTPYSYPDGAKTAYIRVKSDSDDLNTFDTLSLKVSAAGTTGEVLITTNSLI